MLFWIIAAGLAVAVGALLLRAATRARGGAAPEAQDLRIYRDQLAEVDRDLARGVLSPDEAERARVEVSRRLLEADRALTGGTPPGEAPRAATLAVAALTGVAVVGGLFVYSRIGAPGYPDLPLKARIAAADSARASRPSQATAEDQAAGRRPAAPEVEPAFLQLMDRLRAAMQERPDDIQGLRLLAQNEARLGNFAEAHAAQGRLVAALGDRATGQDYADWADLLILSAGGYVSPAAEAALQQALQRDPRNGPARYYSGLLHAQTGRPDLAFRIWRALLEESRPEAPWVPPIEAQIQQVADLAGIRFTPPARPDRAPATPPGRGPSAADVEAAAGMSPEDRAAMIRGMVSGLSDRLATEGGPPEDWARLIVAYGALGETGRAAAIWAEAQTVFADLPEGLATIREAALRAGVAE